MYLLAIGTGFTSCFWRRQATQRFVTAGRRRGRFIRSDNPVTYGIQNAIEVCEFLLKVVSPLVLLPNFGAIVVVSFHFGLDLRDEAFSVGHGLLPAAPSG